MENSQSVDQLPAHTTIQRLIDGKMVTDVLNLSQEEFEKLVKQYSDGFHSEQKYVPFTQEEAEKRAEVGEGLVSVSDGIHLEFLNSSDYPDYDFSESDFGVLENTGPTMDSKLLWAFEQDKETGVVTVVPINGDMVVIHGKQEAETFFRSLTQCFQ